MKLAIGVAIFSFVTIVSYFVIHGLFSPAPSVSVTFAIALGFIAEFAYFALRRKAESVAK
ncbi:hypothetical protein FLK61_34470 [Paenalkalicoccus suaedae]|uniref:Uncharacterized protein n=1 Tax=Paenalkalicoccus suaedae TaxID=2592382 RepID=A0A859FFJ7_9BACI|nr:hypothetical protein [Paenalkalicoccus suaedae]QKS71781.1 hypothetical protein FLK61_34470 [Paenalkalicoccus suaedae]